MRKIRAGRNHAVYGGVRKGLMEAGGWKRFRQEEIGGGEHSSRRKGLEFFTGSGHKFG